MQESEFADGMPYLYYWKESLNSSEFKIKSCSDHESLSAKYVSREEKAIPRIAGKYQNRNLISVVKPCVSLCINHRDQKLGEK